MKVVQADVAIDADCRRLAARAAEWGRLDSWSTMRVPPSMSLTADLDALSAEDFHRIYGVTRSALSDGPGAVLARGGRTRRRARSSVVNALGRCAQRDGSSAYTASKAALNTMTCRRPRACAAHSVNAVCPG